MGRTIWYHICVLPVYAFWGIDGVDRFLFLCGDPKLVLKMFGARIGNDVRIGRYLIIHGALHDYKGLSIGNNVHIGKNCFIDLSDAVIIEDDVTISMRCTLITHFDVGKLPLEQKYPAITAPLQICSNSYVGANAQVLHGVTVAEGCVIGAGALVNKNVSPHSVVAGVPARKIGCSR